jgi:hypothetical protein
MTIRLPNRLRRQTRVVAMQCRLCGCWVKPHHLRIPAMTCRDCETTPAFQTWKPPASHHHQPTPTRLAHIR